MNLPVIVHNTEDAPRVVIAADEIHVFGWIDIVQWPGSWSDHDSLACAAECEDHSE